MAEPDTVGTELRRLRMAAGLSLAELARRVHYNKGYLGRIETGEKPAGMEVARRCDAALDANGKLAALVARARPPEPAVVPEAGPDGGVWVMSMGPDGSSNLVPMSRRDALAMGAASVLALSVGAPGNAAAAGQETTIAAFRALFEQTRRLGQISSPSVVLPIVVAQTHALRGLAGSASAPSRAELLRLAARYAEYAGWMTQEAGDERGALWWTETAVEMASAAGDAELSTYALIRRALITLYREDAAGTIDLAQRALAGSRTPPRIRGLAALREAQGHALACDYDRCRHALDRAAGLLDTADGQEIGPASVSGTGMVAVVTGWCMHDLGRPAEAGEILDRQLALVPSEARRVHARFGARRALAYASGGEVDHACVLAEQAIESALLVDSATVRTDLRRLARTLTRWHTHQPVRELYPRLTAALRTPAV
ncbi:multiprotein-bridging factor 1 family protein [Amycolatopsis sp. NPDC058986]|uniref:helix-turn-helix domain-containing protein n=1 Tax=unclassified Amycolatopsis TaxID=2618356 RepID=UPI00366BBCCB